MARKRFLVKDEIQFIDMLQLSKEQSTKNEILETGIKVIDLIAPIQKVVKSDFLVVLVLVKQSSFKNSLETLLQNTAEFLFAGVGERTREGNDLYHEMKNQAF